MVPCRIAEARAGPRYNRGASHQRMVDYVGQAGLDPRDVAAIYGGNAMRVFGTRLTGRAARAPA